MIHHKGSGSPALLLMIRAFLKSELPTPYGRPYSHVVVCDSNLLRKIRGLRGSIRVEGFGV